MNARTWHQPKVQHSTVQVVAVTACSLLVAAIVVQWSNLLVLLGLPLVLLGLLFIAMKPDVGVALMFATASLETVYAVLGGLKIKPYQLIGLATCAGVAVQAGLSRRSLRSSPLVVPLALLVGSHVFSILVHPEEISYGVALVSLQLLFVVLVILIGAFAGRPRTLRVCLWMLVLGGLVQAVLSHLHAVGFYRRSATVVGYDTILLDGRPAGTFTEPVFLGSFLMAALLLLVPFLQKGTSGMPRGITHGIALLLLTALAVALARSAWMGLLAGALAFLWAGRYTGLGAGRRVFYVATKLTLAGALAVALLAWISPSAFWALTVRARNVLSIVEPENPSRTREQELEGLLTAIWEKPIFGHGIGTSGVKTSYGASVAASLGREERGVVGSGTVLGLLFDQGVVGFLSFAFLLVAVFRRLLQAMRHAHDDVWMPYLLAVFTCLVGLTVFTAFNNLFYFGFYWLVIGLAAAIAEAALLEKRRRNSAGMVVA